MRHGKKINHLGRQKGHREAMLSNMANSLITHKRISTTLAKAKALRKFVEPLLTKSKTDSTHSRRVVFSYLQDKHVLKELFSEVSSKINDRPGGYTRIIKTGNRLGDAAEMCIIELVDFNEELLAAPIKKKSRRRRATTKNNAEESSVEVAGVVEDAVVEEVTPAESNSEDTSAETDVNTDETKEDEEKK